MKRSSFIFLVSKYWWIALLFGPSLAHAAAIAPILGTSSLSPYAVVSETYTNSLNAGSETAIIGNVCFTTGSATPPVSVTGTYGVGCPVDALLVQNAALAVLDGQPCTDLGAGAVNLDAVSIGGGPPGTFPPGCYFNGGAMNIVTGATVTLNGFGVYVFRPGGALTTEANSFVTLAGGACASDVYWRPVGATTLGANAATSPGVPTFVGNIFRGNAAGLSITLGHFAHLTGRVLAFGSTVTTDSNTIDVPVCAAAPPPPTATLTLRKTWGVNSIAGNTVTVTSIGFVNNASSGLSTATFAGNTTTGVPVGVSAGETGTISEAFGLGAAANYNTTLACIGNANALVANSLTVNAADVNIVCTMTNVVGAALAGAGGGDTLDTIGLMILLGLLAVAGVFAVNRFTS